MASNKQQQAFHDTLTRSEQPQVNACRHGRSVSTFEAFTVLRKTGSSRHRTMRPGTLSRQPLHAGPASRAQLALAGACAWHLDASCRLNIVGQERQVPVRFTLLCMHLSLNLSDHDEQLVSNNVNKLPGQQQCTLPLVHGLDSCHALDPSSALSWLHLLQ